MRLAHDLPKICGIYKIQNIKNNKMYIGSSNNLYRRYGEHKRHLQLNKHYNRILQNAWNYYGESSFIFSVLILCDYELLSLFETKFIDYYKPDYNITLDVEGRSTNYGKGSLLAKLRASKLSKILKSPDNIVQSLEYKEQQSKNTKKMWEDVDWRNNILESMRSESCRKKHSEDMKKRNKDKVYRSKITKSLKINFVNGKSVRPNGVKDVKTVRKIRSMYGSGQYSMDDVSKEFGIAISTVSRVVRKESWAWVD